MTYFAPCGQCGKQHARMLRCPNQPAKVVPHGPVITKPGGKVTVAKMPKPPSTTNLVSTKAVSRLTSTTYTGRDAEQRKKQQAALMRKRRAAAKKAAK
jgi:hypothetical protein